MPDSSTHQTIQFVEEKRTNFRGHHRVKVFQHQDTRGLTTCKFEYSSYTSLGSLIDICKLSAHCRSLLSRTCSVVKDLTYKEGMPLSFNRTLIDSVFPLPGGPVEYFFRIIMHRYNWNSDLPRSNKPLFQVIPKDS